MKKRKSRSSWPFGMLCILVGSYLWLWVKLSSSAPPSSNDPTTSTVAPYIIPESKRGSTLIVAFCNFHFRSVGITWYQRMSKLGYDNHLLVATDEAMQHFLETQQQSLPTQIRYQVWIHEPLPKNILSKPKSKQEHPYLETLMAVRWKYLLRQLEDYGMHVVLTDVDNIFTRYLDVDEEFTNKNKDVDVWHAYATKFPLNAFAKQGFCVCSGMSWWRASPGGIRFARLMRDSCGDMCDDQRVLNNLLSTSPKLNMTWIWTTEAQKSRLTNSSTNDPRFLGLPTLGISGHSEVTGHTARIWDRDFAFRGPLFPDTCPPNNWVSMPILDAKSRQTAWLTKLESFQEWDTHCGEQTQSR